MIFGRGRARNRIRRDGLARAEPVGSHRVTSFTERVDGTTPPSTGFPRRESGSTVAAD